MPESLEPLKGNLYDTDFMTVIKVRFLSWGLYPGFFSSSCCNFKGLYGEGEQESGADRQRDKGSKSDVATGHGVLPAARSCKRQEMDAPLDSPGGTSSVDTLT